MLNSSAGKKSASTSGLCITGKVALTLCKNLCNHTTVCYFCCLCVETYMLFACLFAIAVCNGGFLCVCVWGGGCVCATLQDGLLCLFLSDFPA